jgi:hypothetical protein
MNEKHLYYTKKQNIMKTNKFNIVIAQYLIILETLHFVRFHYIRSFARIIIFYDHTNHTRGLPKYDT